MYKYTLTQPTLHLTLPHPTNLTPSFSSSSSRSYMEVVEETKGANDHFLVLEGPHSKRPRSSSLGSASSFGGEGGDGHGNDGSSSSGTTSTIEFFKNTEEEEDMANCLILLAHGRNKNTEQRQNRRKRVKTGEGLESYECKTCNKSFPSFQALGGHRASHKRPKGMINEEKKDLGERRSDSTNAKSDQSLVLPADHNNMAGSNTSKPKVHECSICGSEFSSGQALGGHMRRHRNTIASMKMTKEHEKDEKSRNVYALDLNLPAPEDDIFSSNQPPLVFSAPPLVNCHY